MGIVATDWLITSDVALEVAFRIDLPGPDRGRWVLSYLPAECRFTRAEALVGVVLAEMVVLELEGSDDDWDGEMAAAYAAELGLSLNDALCLLALRGFPLTEGGDDAEPETVPPCTTGGRR
ncbi:hypothetical protein BJY24_003194 [Nocardia transvalensis]|uniref:Uncharacterized protein n=1 Tax=Nocardia transvalensis TaxID=37333 RepID=A0A7W9UIL8_9NOCA|nr:hypothetical protein [Nocardia transvalensis]MBB5914327.1 hypothetical protein [Nocardia transvalensis]